MKLYGSHTSPFVRHCRVALMEGGLAHDFVKTTNQASAEKSPTQRVPFLIDGDVQLTDSTSILRHVRERAGRPFLPTVTALERYCLANTALDTCINLFQLERDGVTVDASPYLARQQSRIETCLAALDAMHLSAEPPYDDVQLRVACFLDWALFRKRLQFDEHRHLTALLSGVRRYEPFVETAPFE